MGEWLRCRISAPGDSPTGPSRTPAGKERTAEDGVHHKTRSRMLYSSFMEKNFYRWGVKNTPSKIFLARIKKKKQRFFFFLRLKNFSFSNISLGAPLLRNTLAKCLRSFYVFKILARLASQVIQKFIQWFFFSFARVYTRAHSKKIIARCPRHRAARTELFFYANA